MASGSQDDILELLRESERLLRLAREGETHSTDDSCVLLFCIVRDCAYKMRHLAQTERAAHLRAGTWDAAQEKRYLQKHELSPLSDMDSGEVASHG